jgi:hypothetical protein
MLRGRTREPRRPEDPTGRALSTIRASRIPGCTENASWEARTKLVFVKQALLLGVLLSASNDSGEVLFPFYKRGNGVSG